jgi:hypothetical protein
MTNGEDEVKCPNCKKAFKIDQTGYANILQQIRDVEFAKALDERVSLIEEKHETEIELVKATIVKEKSKESLGKDKLIAELKGELESTEMSKELAIRNAVDPFKEELTTLKSKVSSVDTEKELLEKSLQEKHQIELENKDAIINLKDEEIELVKDMKLKMSVKEIGEKLEQWCENQFNILRPSAFPHAYFEKDSKSVKEGDDVKGSKGDYIFREADSNEVEFVSIMFEMKDKMDDTKGKTNEYHLNQLDKNRRKKNCEYAVLVSMLEMDNELYNRGIVDMSHKYENMYVVRPQNFIPILTLIRNEARKSLEVRNELAISRSQNLDVENFVETFEEFQGDLSKRVGWARDRYADSIKDVDKAIENLQSLRANLVKSSDHLELAEKKSQGTTIKSLTSGNPTMAAKFDEIADSNDDDDDDDATPIATLPPQ